MHILYTIGSLANSGGVERVLVNKINYLVNQNIKVTIIVNHTKDSVYDLSPKAFLISLEEYKRNENFMVRIPVLGFFYKILVLKEVYNTIINELQPDIVINVERGFEDFILHQLDSKIPCIRESHSSLKASKIINRTGSYKDKFFTYLYNRQLKKFDEVILLTEEDREYRNFENGKTVIPNLISKFEIEPKYNVNSKFAISVGRLDQFKNFKDQIIVWKEIVKSYPEWKLKIFGEGPEKENLNKLIQEMGLSNHVFLMGKSTSIAEEYQKASFFIFTSLAEGFGMVLVESMQMGLPVVSYNCPCGPKDIISQGEDGYLIEVGNKNELKHKIEYLISNPKDRLKLSHNALEKSKLFSEEIIMPQWIKLFSKMTSKDV